MRLLLAYCSTTTLKFLLMPTSRNSTPSEDQQQLVMQEAPARISQWPDYAVAWLESGPDSSTKWYEFLEKVSFPMSSGKTSLALCPPMPDETLPVSSEPSRDQSPRFLSTDGEAPVLFRPQNRAGGMWLGAVSIHSFAAYHNDAVVCSLSEVLEVEVASKYFLTPKACAGILRRAAARGKGLPAPLHRALSTVAARAEATDEKE